VRWGGGYSGYGAYTPQTRQHVIEARYDPTGHRATFTDRSYDIGDQPVTGLALNEANGDLYAATHGRGAYALSLP
jgi:hypothetical protein